MNEPRGLSRTSPEKRLFPTPLQCAFCGGYDREDSPLTVSTWGLSFVSTPFPAHRGCAEDYGYDRVTEHEMREQLQ